VAQNQMLLSPSPNSAHTQINKLTGWGFERAPVHFLNNMGKGTKVSIKAKGTADGVKKALTKILSAPDAPILREGDFRAKMKQGKV
jgi:hypothetical protein